MPPRSTLGLHMHACHTDIYIEGKKNPNGMYFLK